MPLAVVTKKLIILYIQTNQTPLKASTEEFKGIKFVRISSLPEEQRKGIKSFLNSDLIIKILKEGTILTDCLQYDHYVAWYENIYKAKTVEEKPAKKEVPAGKFAIAS